MMNTSLQVAVKDISDINLIRTDTTLDLSQKAEKQYFRNIGGNKVTLRNVTLTHVFRNQVI